MIKFLNDNFTTGFLAVVLCASVIGAIIMFKGQHSNLKTETAMLIEWSDYQHCEVKAKLWNSYICVAKISPKVIMESLATNNGIEGKRGTLSLDGQEIGTVDIYMSVDEANKIAEKLAIQNKKEQ